MPALSKPLAAVTQVDVAKLVDDGWPEDELLEFKETLSQNAAGAPDPWLVDQSTIRQAAKRDILAEVVAMANSYGGDVVLGIRETDEKPPRAAAVEPVPRCVELASRLEMAARDLIKPQIPMLAVRGIPTQDAAGVVVFRVPRSRLAPHRLEISGIEKECYRRVSDRTETMTMREIQDLTFATARGLQAVEDRLTAIREEFRTWVLQRPDVQTRSRGYLIAAIPMSSDLYVPRVHNVAEVTPISNRYRARFAPNGQFFDLQPSRAVLHWRPILRGTEASDSLNRDEKRVLRLTCDGAIIDMTRMFASTEGTPLERGEHILYPGWLFGTLLGVMESVEKFRAAAGAHAVQYALEIHIGASSPVNVWRMGGTNFDVAGALPAELTPLMRYQLGERDTWPELLRVIWCDFWNSIGIEAVNDIFAVQGWDQSEGAQG